MKQFNYSSEIREILIRSWDISKQKKQLITPEIVAYSIVEHYLDNSDNEDRALEKEINKLSSSDKQKLRVVLADFIELSKNRKDPAHFNTGWWGKETIPISEDLCAALLDLPNWASKDKDEEVTDITAGLLLHSIAMRNNGIGNLLFDLKIKIFNIDEAVDGLFDSLSNLRNNGKRLINAKDGSKKSAEDIVKSFFDAITGAKTGMLKEKEIEFDAGEIDEIDNEDDEDDDEEENVFDSDKKALNPREISPESKTPTLDQFALDMTKRASEGGYDPLIGRDSELEQIIEILSCRKKSNAMLLGDPGCGKTAIVEGLAQRIVNKTVPLNIQGKRLLSLNLNDLIAGTKHRGDLEERMKMTLQELTAHSKSIILFLDECHTALGSTSQSSSEIANILKPYLSRGEFQCIGSTTLDEYRKHIEKDKAIVRRFQNIMIDEVSPEETLNILKGIRKKYESFHNVKVSDEVLEKIVEWSGRYVYDRYFPDKAIDVLDLSSSCAKLSNLEKLGVSDKLRKLNEELTESREKKKSLILTQSFEEAAKERDKEEKLEKQIEEISDVSKIVPEISIDDVARVVQKISRVPIDQISSTDMGKLKIMKDELSSKVIGQDEAIKEVVLSLQRNILGLRDENKPIASFLFVGQTGCGKTYISKMIAELFMGSPTSLIKIDMGNYTEQNAVTGLLGSPASYIGYDDEPALLAVKRRRNAVVLFDEIEKASQSILNSVFLSILDEGYVTLSNGTRVNFKDSIVVFTGNIGTKELSLKGGGIGFSRSDGTSKELVESVIGKAVNNQFTPEFLNRLSKVVIFNPLGREELSKIFDLELEKLGSRLKKQGYTLKVDEKVKEKIIDDCDLKYGARDLQRGITKHVETEICEAMLKDDIDITKKNITVTESDVVFCD